MRVTSNTFPNTLINQLGQLALRQTRLQSQAATGQRVTLPSDDPTAMRRVLDLQAESQAHSQYQANIANLKDGANAAYQGVKSLKKISDRANEIAVLADGLKSPEELKVYATEINALLQQAVHVVNTKQDDHYLFAGTRSDAAPFTASTDASGSITGVSYTGNTSTAAAEISPGITLSVQVPGANNSGAGPRGLVADSRSGADLFNHLVSLRDHLLSGNTAAINTTDVASLKNDEDNFIIQMADNGAMQSRLDAMSGISKERSQSIEALISNEADADLSETLVRLSETQNAYKAALQSGGTVLNQSLLDYLR